MVILSTALRGAIKVLAGMTGYLLLLTLAAFRAPRSTPPRVGAPTSRFLLLIPAHNEARLLPSMLANLHALDYPAELYQIHVIADNCEDATAQIAREAGAVVHERFNADERGKPYALRWALAQIWQRGDAHDAVVILDADTVVDANLLRVFDARLARGERAVQSYYAVRDPESSWSASLRMVSLAALHFLRPQGRMVLGGSAGLKGNGMLFAADLLRQHEWPLSLTEDIEYHMALILSGERVTFAPDAVVYAEMPGSLAASSTQNSRWERGRVEMVRRYVPQLLGKAAERRSFVLFDAAVEQIIPPFSILVAATGGALLAALALRRPGLAASAALLLLVQGLYILAGLVIARVPRRVYQALLYAPVFVAWKVWLYIKVLLGRDHSGWVRTARNVDDA